MSDSVVEVGFKANSSALVAAAKAGDKALEGMGDEAANAGKKTKVLGKETQEAARDLDGMSRGARTAGDDVDGFARKAEQASKAASHLGRASQSLRTGGKVVSWGSEKLVNQYTALAGGAGIGLATKQAMDFNHAMTMTAIGARDAAGKIDDMDMSSWLLKTTASVKKLSQETGAPMGEIADGIDQIKSKTGNIHQATSEMELLTKAAIGTGSSVGDIFGLASQLDAKGGIKSVEQMRQALTLLMEQGQSGSFEIKDIVQNGERLFTTMAQFNKVGSKDPMANLRSFGALLQMAKNASGGPAEATTAMERMGAFMSNIHKVEKQLAKTGIHVKLDPRASIEANLKKIIVRASKEQKDLASKALKASDAFGEEGGRLMDALVNEYAAGRGFQQLDSFKTAGGDLAKSTSLLSAFKAASSDAYGEAAKMKSLVVSWSHDMVGGAALSPLTTAMHWINEHGDLTKQALTGIAASLGAMAIAVGAMKLTTLVGEFNAIIGAGKGGRLGGAAGASSAVGSTHVWVDNMGGGMGAIPGAAGKALAAEEAVAAQAAKRGLLARAGGWIASATPSWIKTTGQFFGSTGKGLIGGAGEFASGIGQRAEMWAYQNGMKSFAARLPGLGASALRLGGRAAGGIGIGALAALPFELYSNPDKLRAFIAAGGAGLGGFAGGSLGAIGGLGVASAPLGVVGGIGGSIAGREIAVGLYDMLAGSSNKNLQAAAAPLVSSKPSIYDPRLNPGMSPFQPTFQIYNQVDPQGRTSSRVEGPGALDVKVDSYGSLTAPWALGH